MSITGVIFKGVLLILWMLVHIACATDKGHSNIRVQPPLTLEDILSEVQTRAGALSSYACQLEYIFEQPDFESCTERLGRMYYVRQDKGSRLRISFETLKQDDQKSQPYIEHFLFDGVWLTHIDFQLKSIQKTQMADANEPVDALDLAGRDIPVIGFTGIAQLKDNFDIKMVSLKEKTSKEEVCLHLATKAGSSFKNDYRAILFWLDTEVWLPTRIEATTVEGDIFRIRFIDSKVNQGIDDSIFDVKIPKGFNQPEIIPLNTQGGDR
jgi:outer membrane lipoprotein-sorting protein